MSTPPEFPRPAADEEERSAVSQWRDRTRKWCDAVRDPESTRIRCTEDPGHDGDHIAIAGYFSSLTPAAEFFAACEAVVLARWPRPAEGEAPVNLAPAAVLADFRAALARGIEQGFCTADEALRAVARLEAEIAAEGEERIRRYWREAAAPALPDLPPEPVAPEVVQRAVDAVMRGTRRGAEFVTVRGGEPGELERGTLPPAEPATTRSTEEINPLEAAYWRFDSLRKRKGMPMAERDAFKAAVRGMPMKEQAAAHEPAQGGEVAELLRVLTVEVEHADGSECPRGTTEDGGAGCDCQAADLIARLDFARAAVERMARHNERLMFLVDGSKVALNQAGDRLANLERDRARLDADVSRAHQDRAELEARIAEVELQRDTARSAALSLGESLDAARAESARLRAENADLRAALDAEESARRSAEYDYQETIARLRAEVEAAKKRLAMATAFNVDGREMIEVYGDGWTVHRSGDAVDGKDFTEYLTPAGKWVRVVLNEDYPIHGTADAAFAALALAATESPNPSSREG